jgi:alpha-tubulin suppressor-like RCC1 family protein
MSIQYPGGFITKSPPTVVGPTNGEGGSAPGVWTLDQAMGYEKQGLWPKQIIQKQLWGWGFDFYGQLGLGNITDYSSPKQVGALTTWLQIACSSEHTIATKTDGTLWSWGRNNSGQLGLNNITFYSSPVQVGALTNWLSVACSSGFTIAIKSNGTLWSWGGNTYGQLGLGDTVDRSSPVQVGALTTWLQISSGNNFNMAIKIDGTLWSWGYNGSGQLGLNNITYYSSPKQIGALTNWYQVACGASHVLAVKTNGTLWSWGRNLYYGPLGIGNTVDYSSPKQVGALTTWSQIAGGPSYSIATQTNGTLWSWGYNVQGNLGLGNTTYAFSNPQQVGALTNWYQVACGNGQSVSIKTDGTFWSWGSNSGGKLGLGDTTNRSSPVQVGTLTTWYRLPKMSIASSTMALKTP